MGVGAPVLGACTAPKAFFASWSAWPSSGTDKGTRRAKAAAMIWRLDKSDLDICFGHAGLRHPLVLPVILD